MKALEHDPAELNALRQKIDAVDLQIAALFCERMHIAAQIANWKRGAGKSIYDPAREKAMLEPRLSALSDPSLRPYYPKVLATLTEVSRAYQSVLLDAAKTSANETASSVAEPYAPAAKDEKGIS